MAVLHVFRRQEGQPWHWCQNCSGFPTNGEFSEMKVGQAFVIEKADWINSDDICGDCQRLTQAESCQHLEKKETDWQPEKPKPYPYWGHWWR